MPLLYLSNRPLGDDICMYMCAVLNCSCMCINMHAPTHARQHQLGHSENIGRNMAQVRS